MLVVCPKCKPNWPWVTMAKPTPEDAWCSVTGKDGRPHGGWM